MSDKKYTDVHPLNSPYNHLDAEGLKKWIRDWHASGGKLEFKPKMIIEIAPVGEILEPVQEAPQEPEPIIEEVIFEEILPIGRLAEPEPIEVNISLPIQKKTRAKKPLRIKQPAPEPIQEKQVKETYRKISPSYQELKAMGTIEQRAREILKTISPNMAGFEDLDINWENLSFKSIQLVTSSERRGKFYQVKISGSSPLCTFLKRYLYDEINFQNVIVSLDWR